MADMEIKEILQLLQQDIHSTIAAALLYSHLKLIRRKYLTIFMNL